MVGRHYWGQVFFKPPVEMLLKEKVRFVRDYPPTEFVERQLQKWVIGV
jgi:hypothetical protein